MNKSRSFKSSDTAGHCFLSLEGTVMYPGNEMNEAYWKVAAMLTLQAELRKKRSETNSDMQPEVSPIRSGMRFVVRKFGKLLVIVGCKLVHVGYPDVSSRYM
jgi:hypothetical protein